MIHQIDDLERIRETDGGYETERRDDREIESQWCAIEWHSTLAEAIQAAAYRKIQQLPNDDLRRWTEGSEKVIASYEQILSRAMESGKAQINRSGCA